MSDTELFDTIDGVRARLRDAGTVALVPTMGALHDGHLALVHRAVELADTVVVSIFVNPLQFGEEEDFDRYPRDVEADRALLPDGVIVFAPAAEELYPDGDVQVRLTAGPIGDVFEGASRPGHFDGMLTVVNKLLNIVTPDTVVFGQKDAQQVHLVTRMVQDLNLPVAVDVVPTVRDHDGLALSSRNRFLSADERSVALVLSRSLDAVADSADTRANALKAAHEVFAAEPTVDLDYFELVDPATFLPVPEDFTGTTTAIVAARIGSTRLIDNAPIALG
ncbi:MAG TPA: pantoate--beta-alanine ligase [Terrimesophilobacter sp.]|nr:pantoate--beta-alanine ligase [Terrimesophilobacter sp.]HRQ00684.1 pantoate--beta-alanine ligase [Terrimesophilobacter sp.]